MKEFTLVRLLIIALFCGSLPSCQTQSEQQIHEGLDLPGLASPILLEPDTSRFFLGDYFLNPQKIIGIEAPKGIDFIWDKADQIVQIIANSTELEALTVLRFTFDDGKYDILLKKSERTKLAFKLQDKQYTKVQVKGEMNAWNANAGDMQLGEDGFWHTVMNVAPGKYQYKFVVDGQERSDPANVDSVDNNIGGFNSVVLHGLNNSTLPFLLAESFDENEIVFSSNQANVSIQIFWQNQLLPFNKQGNTYRISIPTSAKNYERSYLRAFISSAEGHGNDSRILLQKGDVVKKPEQLSRKDKESIIMYFLMVDRFVNANPANDGPVNDPDIHPKANHFGGDLEGVIQKIEDGYFDVLGINTLWLSPIIQNAEGAWGAYPKPFTKFSSYHGYWPTSFNRVDYRYGTTNELKELVSNAHKREMNVLLDFVANHVHQDHPFYQANPEVATNLYLPDGSLNTERWDDHRLSTWFDVFMPTLNLERNDVTEMLSDSAVFWLKEYQIDGFRHDATKHIPHLFWRTLTRKVKEQVILAEQRPIIQIGETYGSPELISSYINSGELDSQFDFNLYDEMVAVFARTETPMTRLKAALEESFRYYGQHHAMGNMTGNQDRARFMAYADGSLGFNEDAKFIGWTKNIEVRDKVAYKKLQMLKAFMMAIPGIPVIYYGDEFGMTGAGDPDNRRMMRFYGLSEEENNTLEITKRLIHWRKNSLPALLGQTLILHADAHSMVIERRYFNESDFIIFNKSNQNQIIPIQNINLKKYNTLNGSTLKQAGNQAEIELNAYSFEIIQNR
jgi:cyclomaltodextrinase / maltogenic alpha-amylase / neopullulanase